MNIDVNFYVDRLSIWVTDVREDTDIYVDLVTTTGEVIPLGDIPAYCDMETTVIVNTNSKAIEKV